MQKIIIKTEFIKLHQLLKYANVVSSGGHAKILITEGNVEVNEKKCTEKGKKIREGDIVKVNIDNNHKTFKIIKE